MIFVCFSVTDTLKTKFIALALPMAVLLIVAIFLLEWFINWESDLCHLVSSDTCHVTKSHDHLEFENSLLIFYFFLNLALVMIRNSLLESSLGKTKNLYIVTSRYKIDRPLFRDWLRFEGVGGSRFSLHGTM